MKQEIHVPADEAAEAAVVGCCVSGQSGYRRACEHLKAGDFYKPAHRELFAACAQLTDLDGADVDTEARRIEAAARISGVPVREVRRLVFGRPVMWDRTGAYARKVKEASRKRELMKACSAAFNRLGSGDRIEDVLPELEPLLEGTAA